jgi:hypothetical protein
MPQSAIRYDDVDLVLPVNKIAEALIVLAAGKTLPSVEPGLA